MNLKKICTLGLVAFGISSVALADGFSTTLDMPVIPTSNFSVRLGLNYSLEVSPNLFVGASINPTITPGAANVFSLNARIGAKYVVLLYKDFSSLVNGYVGAGIAASVVPTPFNIGADVNAGLYAITALGGGFKLYGGADGKLGYNFTVGAIDYSAIGYVGVFVEPLTSLELRLQGSAGVVGGAGFFAASSSLYYTIVPQFKVGVTAVYNSNGAFVFGLGALFAEKPGTLGIAGNYLP